MIEDCLLTDSWINEESFQGFCQSISNTWNAVIDLTFYETTQLNHDSTGNEIKK
jgi:hypothetical protein